LYNIVLYRIIPVLYRIEPCSTLNYRKFNKGENGLIEKMARRSENI